MDQAIFNEEMKKRIAMKLLGLKIHATFKRIEVGPVITSFYYEIPYDLPIKKIMNAEEDIAVAAGVESVLISRRGGEIAISLPNKERKIIKFEDQLNDFLYNIKFIKKDLILQLPIFLGVNPEGNFEYLDLAEQPHILIAGSTGGGKSVLLATMIAGLAVTKTPQELRFILVDTKKLDLPLFSGEAHVTDLIEDVKSFHKGFDRLMHIVRTRTEKFKGIARNIAEYNSLQQPKDKLPRYVVVIDELADLIDEDKGLSIMDDEVAQYPRVQTRLKSLLQICRAVGIHVIAATQRPSVKIITGDIKVNFPARIALKVPSRVDSQTILTTTGAEHLLGKGDMLLESAATSIPQRYHGAFIDNIDIVNILNQQEEIRRTYEFR